MDSNIKKLYVQPNQDKIDVINNTHEGYNTTRYSVSNSLRVAQ